MYYFKNYALLLSCFVLLFIIELKPQPFWEETSGPSGGAVSCIEVDNDKIFVGFSSGWFGSSHLGKCLYVSEDEGLNWSSINIISNKDINSIAVDTLGVVFIWVGGAGIFKSSGSGYQWQHLFAGVDVFYDGIIKVCSNNFLVLGHYNGIYVSTNSGSSWNLSFSGSTKYIYIDSTDNIFAGLSNGGLFKSTDYGTTWIPASQGLTGSVKALVQYNDTLLFAGTEAGIYTSYDSGLSWHFIENSPSNISAISIGIKNKIFACTEKEGFFFSKDLGETWTQRNTGLENYFITSMAILPSGSVVIGLYGEGLYKNSKELERWEPINSTIKSNHITSFIKFNDFLFAGSQYGIVYKSSDNGSNWIRTDSTYTNYPITAFGKSENGSLFFSAFDYPYESIGSNSGNSGAIRLEQLNISDILLYGKLFKSSDEGNTWREITDLFVDAFSNYYDSTTGTEYILAAASIYGVYISTDDGESWYSSSINLQGEYIEDVKVNSSGIFFASSSDKIFRSVDFGRSWQVIYIGASTVYHVAIEVASNDFLYAVFDWGKIILSTDNGDTWLDKGENLNVNRVNSITTDSLNNVFIGNWWGEIYMSVDNGDTWRNIKAGMIGAPVLNIFCDNENNIFIGPYAGAVYKGINFFVPPQVQLFYPGPIANNISLTPTLKWFSSPTAIVYRVQISLDDSFDSLSVIYDYTLSDTTVKADTLEEMTEYFWRASCANNYGWSAWSISRKFKTTSVNHLNENQEEHRTYELLQNYPNPFNPITKISYELPKTTEVDLKIFNTLGQEVATLVKEEKQPGYYEVEFNASTLASGIYYYTLRAGDFIQTKKMILLK